MLKLIFYIYLNEVKKSYSGITIKAQKDKDFVCLSMLDYASVTIDQNIGGFGLKWPPI